MATVRTEAIRGTPMPDQLFVTCPVFPQSGAAFTPVVSAMVRMGINGSAYQAEYFTGTTSRGSS